LVGPAKAVFRQPTAVNFESESRRPGAIAGTPVRLRELGEDRPRLGERYRCHICRLELTLDPTTNKLTVTPLLDDDDRARSDKRL